MTLKGVAKMARNEAGMTLIEIMVVLAIIGAIAALATIQIMGSLEKSRVETTKIQIKNIEGALDLYKRDNGSYPTTEQGLDALVTKPSVGKVPNNYPEEGYLKAVPKDGWGNEFVYASPGASGHKVEIISYGADGAEGGTGNDADLANFETKEETKANP